MKKFKYDESLKNLSITQYEVIDHYDAEVLIAHVNVNGTEALQYWVDCEGRDRITRYVYLPLLDGEIDLIKNRQIDFRNLFIRQTNLLFENVNRNTSHFGHISVEEAHNENYIPDFGVKY